MTLRVFYAAVEAREITDEIVDFAKERIEKMDAELKAAQEKRAEKAAEKAPIREAILACITEDAKTATTLIEESGQDIKPQAIPSLLKPLIEEGVVVKTDVKIEGKKLRGYVRG